MNRYKLAESLKYFIVLFQMKANYIKYLKSVIKYKASQKVEFPRSVIRLGKNRFLTRKKSMDIAHLSYLYERETTKFLQELNPNVFIDVGAHIGRFSILLANRNSKVVSLEPSKENYKQLVENIHLNGLGDKVIALPIGCSDKNREKVLYFSSKNEGQTSFKKIDGARRERSEVKRLDKICDKLNIMAKHINVIKIDVEGSELDVLKGATRILKQGSPILVVEITDGKNKRKIERFLMEFGFFNKKVLDSRNFVFVKVNNCDNQVL